MTGFWLHDFLLIVAAIVAADTVLNLERAVKFWWHTRKKRPKTKPHYGSFSD